jgi:type I site-specific restriction-modification system R (restriction) subunit
MATIKAIVATLDRIAEELEDSGLTRTSFDLDRVSDALEKFADEEQNISTDIEKDFSSIVADVQVKLEKVKKAFSKLGIETKKTELNKNPDSKLFQTVENLHRVLVSNVETFEKEFQLEAEKLTQKK